MSTKKPTELTPEKFEGLKTTEVPDYAAGVKALTSSFAHLYEEMGIPKAMRLLNKMNQKGGFDCPGCAWPDPDDHRTFMAEYCENGVKAIAEEATEKKVDEAFFKKHSIQELGDQTDYWLGKSGRVVAPMLIEEGQTHYRKISWEEAFQLVADELKQCETPHEAVFYTSGRTSNEAAFMYQLMVRKFGTNNLPDCSNMCHESSGSALSATVGIGKGSVTLDDIHEAEVVMVIGQNPGTNHPRMLSALKQTKANGGKVISINPLPEAGLVKFKDPQNPVEIFGKGTVISDLFLPVKINADVALLKAITLLMLAQEDQEKGSVFDWDFINEKTAGVEEYLNDLRTHDYQQLVKESGVEESLIKQTAQLLIEKKKIIICWAMGLTQHKNGVGNIQEVVNILLLKGSIGKKGAGTCPVRGHSNVQGDRTMGIWEKPPVAFLDQLEKKFNFKPPHDHGYDVVESIEAMYENKVKVFFGMGGNFLSATPDTSYTAQGLRNCNLTVHVSTKLNRSHVVHGKKGLILPCLGRSEADIQNGKPQFVSVENSMGVVSSSEGKETPASKDLKSEVAIVCEIGHRLFPKDSIQWLAYSKNYDLIRDAIEAVIPGFDNYNQKVRKPEGFYLPNNAREADFSKLPGGRAQFTINTVPKWQLKKGEYLMMTIRTHDQYNTTIYGMHDRYRGIYNERRVVLMNEQDMKEAGLKKNDVVNLTSHFNGEERHAAHFLVVPYPIPSGCTATYFPETNVLVPIGNRADKSQTPVSKSIVITIEKA